ncbi:MAG: phosphotransferase [Pseudomonadales bacterium]
MKVIDTGKLTLFASKKWVNILVDAIGDRSGRSLPFDVDTFTAVNTLNHVINAHGVQPLHAPARITSVNQQDIPSVSSNCHNVVLSIEQEGEAVLPSSLFVKLPMPSLTTRWFFSIIGSWQLESYFFKHVAPNVPLRTPHTYATHSEGTRFFLIQENLHEDPSVQLFTNPDMMAGPSLELVHRCLDSFARLHAHHYNLRTDEREAILPLDNHPFLGPQMRIVSQALNSLGLKPCMKRLPGCISADVVEAYKKTLRHWDELLGFWFSGPLSLLHGDSHLGNFFVSGDEMGMLDFQAVHWGKGIRDVQYFLIDSLPTEILAAHEQDLVRYYVDRRGHHGTAIELDRTWQEYRSFTYHTLMTIVVSIGFGALNKEQNSLMEEILGRAVAAVQRVDYAGWLEDFLSGLAREPQQKAEPGT